jgi:NAD(P)-dependent dehydrogenase (short-subunit alcohol dehydrogenase family)
MARFDGKVALITGAASGIGKDIALHFAAEGGIPVIADLNLDAAGATAKDIRGNGRDAFAVGMNVADEAAVEKGVADTMTKYSRIDVLVSNAGIQIVNPVVDFPFADWKRLLAIHLDGAFLTTKACLGNYALDKQTGMCDIADNVGARKCASILPIQSSMTKQQLGSISKPFAGRTVQFARTAA